MPVFAARTTGFEGEIVSMPLKSSYCQTGFDQKNNLSPMSTKRTTNPRRLSICGSSCCAVAMGSSLLLYAVVLDSTNSTGIFALHALDGQARQAAQGRCLHFPHHICLILARGHSRRPACQGSRSWAIHSNAPVDLDLLNYLVEHPGCYEGLLPWVLRNFNIFPNTFAQIGDFVNDQVQNSLVYHDPSFSMLSSSPQSLKTLL
jgi:hypothetical protein